MHLIEREPGHEPGLIVIQRLYGAGMALVQHRPAEKESCWGNWLRVTEPLALEHAEHHGMEIPLARIALPADVLDTLTHYAFEKDLLSLADIGNLVTAMHSVLDLERIRVAGVKESGWRDEARDVFEWILEGVRLQKTGAELGRWVADIAGEVGLRQR